MTGTHGTREFWETAAASYRPPFKLSGPPTRTCWWPSGPPHKQYPGWMPHFNCWPAAQIVPVSEDVRDRLDPPESNSTSVRFQPWAMPCSLQLAEDSFSFVPADGEFGANRTLPGYFALGDLTIHARPAAPQHQTLPPISLLEQFPRWTMLSSRTGNPGNTASPSRSCSNSTMHAISLCLSSCKTSQPWANNMHALCSGRRKKCDQAGLGAGCP